MFTYVDVLERAIQIIQRGNHPFLWSDHGECCPWCAASMAKGELDDENNTGVSVDFALYQYFNGRFDEVESDEPLVFARKALGKWNDIDLNSITRDKAIEILSQAKSVIVTDAPNNAPSGFAAGRVKNKGSAKAANANRWAALAQHNQKEK